MHKLRCFGLGLSSTSTGIFIYIYNLNMAFTFDIVLLCPVHFYYMACTFSLSSAFVCLTILCRLFGFAEHHCILIMFL